MAGYARRTPSSTAAETNDETASFGTFAGDDPEFLDGDEAGEAMDIVDDSYFANAFDHAVDESGPGAVGIDAFQTFTSLLEKGARAAGAGESDISLLRELLDLLPIENRLAENVVDDLEAGGIVDGESGRLAPTARFCEQVHAWRSVLRCDSVDFGECGPATLDEWASDLIARIMGNAARAPSARRELRKLGIAAFGLVATAA